MSYLSTERLEENYSCFFLNKTIGAYVLIYAECILSEFFFFTSEVHKIVLSIHAFS